MSPGCCSSGPFCPGLPAPTTGRDWRRRLNKQSPRQSHPQTRVPTLIEEWASHHKTNIYITDTRVVHNTFYKLACAGDVYNVGIKMSEKEGITRFKYENGNMIIFNPDINSVIETIKL